MKQRAGDSCVGESSVQEAAADVKAACRRQLQMSGSVREAAADMKAACRRQLQMKLWWIGGCAGVGYSGSGWAD
jgi:hypothetical protein